MTTDSTTARSRRALLGAGLGAIAATLASALGRPTHTDAANPPLLLNQDNVATELTTIRRDGIGTAFVGSSDSGTGIKGSSDSGYGVDGGSYSEVGVRGSSVSKWGVYGLSTSSNGIYGHSSASGASGVYGDNLSRGYGVAGRSNSQPLGENGVFASATLGDNTADGVGVWGRSAHGIGVFADAANPDAVAFTANGVTRFARSGRLAIAVGDRSASPLINVRIDAGTLVLATLQKNQSGLWIQSAVPDPAGNTFTVTLNKAVAGLVPIKVAWFLVN